MPGNTFPRAFPEGAHDGMKYDADRRWPRLLAYERSRPINRYDANRRPIPMEKITEEDKPIEERNH